MLHMRGHLEFCLFALPSQCHGKIFEFSLLITHLGLHFELNKLCRKNQFQCLQECAVIMLFYEDKSIFQ